MFVCKFDDINMDARSSLISLLFCEVGGACCCCGVVGVVTDLLARDLVEGGGGDTI